MKLEFLGHFPVRLGPKPVLPKSKVKEGIYLEQLPELKLEVLGHSPVRLGSKPVLPKPKCLKGICLDQLPDLIFEVSDCLFVLSD